MYRDAQVFFLSSEKNFSTFIRIQDTSKISDISALAIE